MKSHHIFPIVLFSTALFVSACGNIGQPLTRMGMVKDPDTGLMFGSVVERNIVTDASFFKNRKIKIRTRNTSGDEAFDLRDFTKTLKDAYASNGYEPTTDSDFGLILDVNVMYSGQVQTNLTGEYGFLGVAAGGIAGVRSNVDAGTAIGVVAGATLGSILGSFITDDTYIIIARVTFGQVKNVKKSKKTVTFSRSEKLKNIDDDEEEITLKRGFKKTITTRVSVYAGGRNVSQAEIADQVRQRIIRIVSDII